MSILAIMLMSLSVLAICGQLLAALLVFGFILFVFVTQLTLGIRSMLRKWLTP